MTNTNTIDLKKTITTLTITILLISTIAFITIQPATATPAEYLTKGGLGEVSWSKVEQKFGDWSVKLFLPDEAPAITAYASIIIPYGKSFDTIPTVESEGTYDVVDVDNFYFWVKLEAATETLPSPYIVLDLDSDADGEREYALVSMPRGLPTDGWQEFSPPPDIDGEVGGGGGWFCVDVTTGIPLNGGEYSPIGYWMNTKEETKSATVLNIKIWYGEWDAPRTQDETAYVDDLTVDTVTYPLEPIVLDKDYYKIGASVAVEVVDIYANLRPEVVETIEVTAASNYPDQITVELTETDINTGIFEGTFSIVEEIPGLLVRDGSIITVTYDGLSDTAEVDNTAPQVTVLDPPDEERIKTQTPTISAALSDTPEDYVVESGIASATMKLDGEIVAMTPLGIEEISYPVPPFAPLDEGIHTVQVIVSDVAGNLATETWSFTVDLTEPTVVSVVVDPDPAGPVEVEFKLTFSQDIEVAPTVTFGLTSPYMAYTVSETSLIGAVWIGTATISAGGDGLNTIRIAGAEDIAGNVMVTDTSNTFMIDTVAPTKPADLNATATDVSITLTWTASTDEDGTGVDCYEIYRDTKTVVPLPATLIATVDHLTTTYTDYGPLELGTYYYMVRAFDYAENYADSEVSVKFVPDVVIAYPVELVEGWNLVSLPLIPEDPSIEVVLADVLDNVVVVWSYNASTTPGTWLCYLPAVPELSDLTEMVDGEGYWVKTTADATLIVYGTELPEPPATPPVYHVYAGWNLIGFKEIDSMDITGYLTTIPADLRASAVIYGWDAAKQRYQLVYLAGKSVDSAVFVPGQGYWLYLVDEADIAPP